MGADGGYLALQFETCLSGCGDFFVIPANAGIQLQRRNVERPRSLCRLLA